MARILNVAEPDDEKILRRKIPPFDFVSKSKKEIEAILKEMRVTMDAANGIGLAANQVGLDIRVFVAKVDNKFYAVFNPEIIKSEEFVKVEGEGCLSVPERFGSVKRYNKIVLKGYDRNGKVLKIKAWNLLAWVFQHEVDHLDGKLFIDKLK